MIQNIDRTEAEISAFSLLFSCPENKPAPTPHRMAFRFELPPWLWIMEHLAAMSHSEPRSLESEERPSGGGKPCAFATTHWSVVLQAGRSDASGAVALEHLCRIYWYPIYAFIRRRGSDHHHAEDLTQAFFAHLLEQDSLAKADRVKGKFRSFLLAALTNFLANERDKARTLKRGGQRQIISLESEEGEALYLQEPVDLLSPEKLFDRRWALILVEGVLARLRQEYDTPGKRSLFRTVEAGLTDEVAASVYGDWAIRLEMSKGAVRVALHRLRRRFGEALRDEVAQTVSTPEEVEEEIRNLFASVMT